MDKTIHHSVYLNCDVSHAFKLFTLNCLLESWLVPVAEVEPEVGGKYEPFWQPEDRENNSTIGCCVTAIVPNSFLSFEWRSPKQYKHFANNADPLTHVVVCFSSEGKSAHVNLIHSGWRSSEEWEEARQWQDSAWNAAFLVLEKQVNGATRN